MSTSLTADFTIYYLSEHAVTLQFGDEISTIVTDKINSLYAQLVQSPFLGFISAVPAYTTLSIFYNPLIVNRNKSLEGNDCFEKVTVYLHSLGGQQHKTSVIETNTVTIPVCYEDDYGPDLKELAANKNMDANDVIKAHSTITYKVGMIGFLPGFAYLTGLPDLLASPRKHAPRKSIPAGSVGIAGKQTGIYSLQSPGGWQIIGCTPLKMFDVNRAQPSLLKNGDQVIFKPISNEEFEYLIKNTDAGTRS